MTQWGYEDGDDAGQGNTIEANGPKALRDAYEAQKKQNEELKAGLEAIQTELRQQKLTNVFESLGVPGAANLYQGDADPQKAKEWVHSMQNVFGGGNVQGSAPQSADSVPAPPVLDDQQQAQYQRMTEAGQHGTPVGNVEAALAAVGDASDMNSLIAAFNRAAQMG